MCYNCITTNGTVGTEERRNWMVILDYKSSKPIYEQIIEQIIDEIEEYNELA